MSDTPAALDAAAPDRSPPHCLAGIALLSCALLILEIGTTRLLSVAMAYHFAVLSISLAMLGLAAGGLLVHAFPAPLDAYGRPRTASLAALLFGISTSGALLALLGLPINPVPSLAGSMNLVLLFVPQAVPYVFAGTAIGILIASFPGDVGRLYGADLAGAGAGCLVAALALPRFGGPATILLGGTLAALSSWLLGRAGAEPLPRLLRPAPWSAVLALLFLLGVTTQAFELVYVKGYPQLQEERVRWLAHSRLAFSRELCGPYPFGWGFGRHLVPKPAPYCRRRIQIDGMAETPILRWSGASDDVSHVLWDVTSMPYHLRTGRRALVVGCGGGRDIVTALLTGSWEIDGAEINEGIVHAMTHDYADFSGRVYLRPGVNVQNVDGRFALERAAPGSYDVVQMSAVDTWATGQSGSLALMENGLYTVESFEAILRALAPSGLASISRFKYPEDHFGETARMIAIALEALERSGRGDARNLMLVTNGGEGFNIATMLMSPTPISDGDLARAATVAAERGFEIVWPTGGVAGGDPSPVVGLLAAGTREARERIYAGYPIDIRPTWDDRPFFFHQARLASVAHVRDVVNPGAALRLVPMLTILRLGLLLLAACSALVVLPAFVAGARGAGRPTTAPIVYFLALGVGFMFYEIPLVQKLTLGLGHPTEALTVVLFGLLAGTGLGSYATERARVLARLQAPLALAAGAAGVMASVGGLLVGIEVGMRGSFLVGAAAYVAAAAASGAARPR